VQIVKRTDDMPDSRDYEAMVCWAMIRITSRRLTHP
jgi:hypothetical protein